MPNNSFPNREKRLQDNETECYSLTPGLSFGREAFMGISL